MGQFWAQKEPGGPPCNALKAKRLSFGCPSMIVTIFLRLAKEKQPAKRGTRKPKVSRLTSGYGGILIQLSPVGLSQKNRGFIGAAKKMQNFGPKMQFFGPKSIFSETVQLFCYCYYHDWTTNTPPPKDPYWKKIYQ